MADRSGSPGDTEQQGSADVVVFRKCLIVLFPESPADLQGWYGDRYEHVGQHGTADYFSVIRATAPVVPGSMPNSPRNFGGSATT